MDTGRCKRVRIGTGESNSPAQCYAEIGSPVRRIFGSATGVKRVKCSLLIGRIVTIVTKKRKCDESMADILHRGYATTTEGSWVS